MNTLKKTLWVATVAATVILTACGGGGGDGQGNNSVSWNATPDWVGNSPGNSGNSNNDGNSAGIKTESDNTVPIRVDNSMGNLNMLSASITVCVPGQPGRGQCVTVDNMLVDTGSTGVRIAASALQSLNPKLLTQIGALDDTTGAFPIAECMPFASGFTWGSVKRADIKIGSRTASNIPVQVMGDGAFTTPSDCIAHGGADYSTARSLGANGILGIGHGVHDSKDALTTAIPGNYYYCPSANSCVSTRVKAEKQVMNPVAAFSADYNGTIIRLPAVPASGQASVTGELIFGVGTQANNALPADANIFTVDTYGFLTTHYQGTAFNYSAIDSGTNVYAFADSAIPTTSDFYTPASALDLSATIEASAGSGAPLAVPFQIENALNLGATGNAAFNNVGASMSSGRWFLWGLPFFYGRSVYTVIGDSKIGTLTGPFVAF
ncbi:DUF3443 domain-containing protein [Paraburkholderia sp. 22099]|uniref:DUF3443 domain-containing protein n=1 Tax=Paraburkholderia sp. 22099 TaxID=3453875 RepID=UPI003F838B97